MLRSLLIVNATLQWLDAASTLAMLSAGGVEGNPLMRRVMEEAGVGGFMILKLIVALAIIVFLPYTRRLRSAEARRASYAALGLAVAMAGVVAWNTYIALHA